MTVQSLILPWADDFHVHLRQGTFMESLAPCVKAAGVKRCLVMPNLSPPITTAAQAVSYRNALKTASPDTEFLMTLYLTSELTVEELTRAKENGVVGVKSYPRGVTTGSASGVESYEQFYPIFERMQELGLILHFHGEVPGECVMTAEAAFLQELEKIHSAFPSLRIILEHVTTSEGIETVKRCGDSVAATITAHHLDLTIDNVVGNSLNFCKPVAKLPKDRSAIQEVIRSGHPRFFLGSDSAPHPVGKKICHECAAAGIFTQPYLMCYLADSFDQLCMLHRLNDFACVFGSLFYKLPSHKEAAISLVEEPFVVPNEFKCADGQIVIPYKAGQVLKFSLKLL